MSERPWSERRALYLWQARQRALAAQEGTGPSVALPLTPRQERDVLRADYLARRAAWVGQTSGRRRL